MRLSALLVLTAGVTANSWSAERTLPVAIRDAHVVTVSGADLPRGTVVLRDGLFKDPARPLATSAI